jgi:hypothetical protein
MADTAMKDRTMAGAAMKDKPNNGINNIFITGGMNRGMEGGMSKKILMLFTPPL